MALTDKQSARQRQMPARFRYPTTAVLPHLWFGSQDVGTDESDVV